MRRDIPNQQTLEISFHSVTMTTSTPTTCYSFDYNRSRGSDPGGPLRRAAMEAGLQTQPVLGVACCQGVHPDDPVTPIKGPHYQNSVPSGSKHSPSHTNHQRSNNIPAQQPHPSPLHQHPHHDALSTAESRLIRNCHHTTQHLHTTPQTQTHHYRLPHHALPAVADASPNLTAICQSKHPNYVAISRSPRCFAYTLMFVSVLMTGSTVDFSRAAPLHSLKSSSESASEAVGLPPQVQAAAATTSRHVLSDLGQARPDPDQQAVNITQPVAASTQADLTRVNASTSALTPDDSSVTSTATVGELNTKGATTGQARSTVSSTTGRPTWSEPGSIGASTLASSKESKPESEHVRVRITTDSTYQRESGVTSSADFTESESAALVSTAESAPSTLTLSSTTSATPRLTTADQQARAISGGRSVKEPGKAPAEPQWSAQLGSWSRSRRRTPVEERQEDASRGQVPSTEPDGEVVTTTTVASVVSTSGDHGEALTYITEDQPRGEPKTVVVHRSGVGVRDDDDVIVDDVATGETSEERTLPAVEATSVRGLAPAEIDTQGGLRSTNPGEPIFTTPVIIINENPGVLRSTVKGGVRPGVPGDGRGSPTTLVSQEEDDVTNEDDVTDRAVTLGYEALQVHTDVTSHDVIISTSYIRGAKTQHPTSDEVITDTHDGVIRKLSESPFEDVTDYDDVTADNPRVFVTLTTTTSSTGVLHVIVPSSGIAEDHRPHTPGTSAEGSTSADGTGNDDDDGVFTLPGVRFSLRDLVLAVCATVGCMFTIGMLVTFTRCCCKRQKDDSGDDEPRRSTSSSGRAGASGTSGSGKSLWKRSWRRPPDSSTGASGASAQESSTSENLTQVTIERRDSYSDGSATDGDGDDEGGFTTSATARGRRGRSGDTSRSRRSHQKESGDNRSAPTVKDRIRAFEAPLPEGASQVVKVREGAKPRKNKPTSKAFEEFESRGILIGFGGPRKRYGEDDEDMDDHEGGSDSPLGILLPSPTSGHSLEETPTSSRCLEDDEGVHTMESEEDEFAAVQRNAEILKSFRRAPPPRNRSKARRSGRGRRMVRGQELSSSEQIAEEPSSGSFGSRPTSGINSPATSATPDDEQESFEASLHMTTTTESLSAARSSSISQTPQSSLDSMDSPKRQPSLSSRDSPMRAGGGASESPKRLLDSPKRQLRESPKRTPPLQHKQQQQQRSTESPHSPRPRRPQSHRAVGGGGGDDRKDGGGREDYAQNGPADFSLSIPVEFQQQRLGSQLHHRTPSPGQQADPTAATAALDHTKPFSKPYRPKSYHVELSAVGRSSPSDHHPPPPLSSSSRLADRGSAGRPARPVSSHVLPMTEMAAKLEKSLQSRPGAGQGAPRDQHLREPQPREGMSLSHGHLARNLASPVDLLAPPGHQSANELRRWESEHSYLQEEPRSAAQPSTSGLGSTRRDQGRDTSPDQRQGARSRERQTLRPSDSQPKEHPHSEKLERKVLIYDLPATSPEAAELLSPPGGSGAQTSEDIPDGSPNSPPPRPPLPSWRQIRPPLDTVNPLQLPPRVPLKGKDSMRVPRTQPPTGGGAPSGDDDSKTTPPPKPQPNVKNQTPSFSEQNDAVVSDKDTSYDVTPDDIRRTLSGMTRGRSLQRHLASRSPTSPESSRTNTLSSTMSRGRSLERPTPLLPSSGEVCRPSYPVDVILRGRSLERSPVRRPRTPPRAKSEQDVLNMHPLIASSLGGRSLEQVLGRNQPTAAGSLSRKESIPRRSQTDGNLKGADMPLGVSSDKTALTNGWKRTEMSLDVSPDQTRQTNSAQKTLMPLEVSPDQTGQTNNWKKIVNATDPSYDGVECTKEPEPKRKGSKNRPPKTSKSWHGNLQAALSGTPPGGYQEDNPPWIRPKTDDNNQNLKPSDIRRSMKRSSQEPPEGQSPKSVSSPDRAITDSTMPSWKVQMTGREHSLERKEAQLSQPPSDFERNAARSQSLRTPKSPTKSPVKKLGKTHSLRDSRTDSRYGRPDYPRHVSPEGKVQSEGGLTRDGKAGKQRPLPEFPDIKPVLDATSKVSPKGENKRGGKATKQRPVSEFVDTKPVVEREESPPPRPPLPAKISQSLQWQEPQAYLSKDLPLPARYPPNREYKVNTTGEIVTTPAQQAGENLTSPKSYSPSYGNGDKHDSTKEAQELVNKHESERVSSAIITSKQQPTPPQSYPSSYKSRQYGSTNGAEEFIDKKLGERVGSAMKTPMEQSVERTTSPQAYSSSYRQGSQHDSTYGTEEVTEKKVGGRVSSAMKAPMQPSGEHSTTSRSYPLSHGQGGQYELTNKGQELTEKTKSGERVSSAPKEIWQPDVVHRNQIHAVQSGELHYKQNTAHSRGDYRTDNVLPTSHQQYAEPGEQGGVTPAGQDYTGEGAPARHGNVQSPTSSAPTVHQGDISMELQGLEPPPLESPVLDMVPHFTRDPRWKEALVKPEAKSMYDKRFTETTTTSTGYPYLLPPEAHDTSPKDTFPSQLRRDAPDVVPISDRRFSPHVDTHPETELHFKFNFEVEATDI